ncbi:MAG: SDR family NAD(P)-dependent oxidoreductase [Balneola sp.]
MCKTIFITGSTDGIGKLAAKKLAAEGHKIIVHGRNPDKLKSVLSELKAENTDVTGYIADFSDLRSVKKLTQEIIENNSVIDVLINNAGIYKSKSHTTGEGLDVRFTVNYLAPYLLTKSLLPIIKQSASSRVINLSSAAQSTVSFDALLGKHMISDQAAYAQSKLALTMWSFFLANEDSNINVIAVNPGSLLNTNMVKEAFGRHWSSPEKGASILYDLAVSETYKDDSGSYFDNDLGAFNQAHTDAYNQNKISELISTTEEIINNL